MSKRLTPMECNPIARFNLNIDGTNPDNEIVSMDATVLELQQQFTKTHQKPNNILQAELDEQLEWLDPKTGQKFGVMHLNRSAKGIPLVVTLSWGVNHDTHMGTREEVAQTAIQTGREMWVINNPSTGSDKLTKDQRKQLESHIGFQTIACSILRAMQNQGIKEVDLEGTSMGGRIAVCIAAYAHHYDIIVYNAVLIDPPGFENKQVLIQGRDFAAENPRLSKYVELSHEPATQSEKQRPTGTLRYFARLARADLLGIFKSYTKAMAKATIPSDIYAALRLQPHLIITIIYGTESNISSPRKIVEFYYALAIKEKKRLRLKVLPGDTHALGGGLSKRIAWYINQSLVN